MTEKNRAGNSKQSPTCEIVTIGSELLLGQITDTNTTYLAGELSRIGVTVSFRTAVADNLKEIKSIIRCAAARCDVVITTGGLGPTLDDLTREAVAEAAGVTLEFREDLMAQISEMFRSSSFTMTENNRRQAYVPEGALAVSNPVGTAPSFIADVKGKPVVSLPGVPRELKYLMKNEILPWLQKRFNLEEHNITYRVLKTAGIGESAVDNIIGDLMGEGSNPEVGLLASAGEIKIRITARASDSKEASGLIKPVEEEIRERLGNKIFGQDDDTLEQVLGALLAERDLTLGVFETFTGGIMAQQLYQAQVSRLIGSRVAPDLKAVQKALQVRKKYSDDEIARSLALIVKEETGADLGLALFGFPVKNKGRYVLNADLYIAGNGIDEGSAIQTGGELSNLRQRGSVIAMNILRLLLSGDN